MPGLEGDVSSFNQPLPVGALKQAQDIAQTRSAIQQNQSNDLSIDKQKLDLVNQHMTIANHELSILAGDKDITQEKVTTALNRIAKTTNMPAPVYQKMHEEYASAGNDPIKLKQLVGMNLRRGMSVQEQLNNQYGVVGTSNNGQQVTPIQTSQQKGTITPIAPPIQQQIPPTAEVATPAGNQALGPQNARTPEGTLPIQGGLPGQYTPSPAPSRLPVADRNAANAGANPTAFENKNGYKPTGPMTSQSPMFEEGKKQLAEDQALATQKLTAIKPAEQALSLMKNLRSGPGTSAWNTTVAALKANNIISTQSSNDPTAVYQEVNKYMNDYLSRRGGSTDAAREQLMKSSPDIGTQILPALIQLTRSAVAQDKMEASRAAAFEGADYSKYGNHRVSYPQSLDQRAFDINNYEPKDRQALIKEMREKADKGIEEGLRFKKSLEIAYKQGLVKAP